MWPTLAEGDLVTYKSIPVERLSLGDLIVFRGFGRKGEKCEKVHRLIGRAGPFFLEAGDNAFSASLVPGEAILGKVIRAESPEGRQKPLQGRPSWRSVVFPPVAQGFIWAHEAKDRILGNRKSWWLWKASEAYRKGLHWCGIEVPVIPPKA